MEQQRGQGPSDVSDILEQMTAELREAAERVVPRFLATMPPEYFRGTDEATRLAHIKAIITTEATGLSQELTLRNDDGSRITVINENSYPGQLAALIAQLPNAKPLRAARVHTARDGRFVLDVFEFGESAPFDRKDPEQAASAQRVLEWVAQNAPDLESSALERHFEQCAAHYILSVPAPRICRHYRLREQIYRSDDTVVFLEPIEGRPLHNLIVGVSRADLRETFERTAWILGRHHIDIQSAHLDTFDADSDHATSFLSFVVRTDPENSLQNSSLWKLLRDDLLRVKWLDEASFSLVERIPDGHLKSAEVLRGLCHLAHQVLVKVSPFAFSRDNLVESAVRHPNLSGEIVKLFLERFDPAEPMQDPEFGAAVRQVSDRIRESVDKEEDQAVLMTLVTAVVATRRTNVHVPTRYAFAASIDPSFLASHERADDPYGVFFVHGRDFDGFHVRFRAIARGGVRIVKPRSQDQFAFEGERLYDEVYALAFAQQLKNKDIPEGGSKGVLLVTPTADATLCAKAYASSLLDLVSPDSNLRGYIVDLDGREDLLYLGPDENISNELIDWIVEHAARRGYPVPSAFMSSKTAAGINHKEYGVTSEGVTVFLDVVLRSIGIDPRAEPFTLKMTGGPDGDVAGNELRILHREYGENARIVGISDGSGSAEDPDGLDHRELLRLVDAGLAIADFDPDYLGPKGRVTALDQPDGFKLRNTLHNRVEADAFIPAGGRPKTLRDSNWNDFLRSDGTPSSPVIIEGANLFLTPEARQGLSDAGVLIVKDSSANKCGVICSSFEVLASMVLSEAEFVAHKEIFVAQVIERLRHLARLEAELLMRERHHKPDITLPDLSTRISQTMIAASDAVVEAIPRLDDADGLMAHNVMRQHVPPLLYELKGESVLALVPTDYVNAAIAAVLAGTIVYREGLSYLESMSKVALADVALRYLRQEQETGRLVAQVEASGLVDRERIAELLCAGGTGAALRVRS